jgi:hypothetical protein
MNDKKNTAEKQEIMIAPADNRVEALIAKAIDKNVPVETMERLLVMRRELKAEWAKEAFDRAMAVFQEVCPIIEKTSKVSFNTTSYSYASLDEIVRQVKGLLAKNGFSYTFDTEKTNNAITTYCKVKHQDGHMEVSKFEITIDTNAKMNISQRDGAASSYSKRYAFCNAFGILTGDEDTDARTPTINVSNNATEPTKGYVDEEGITHEVYTREPQTETSEDVPVCYIHQKGMRKRLRKDGGYWFDHRWQENGVWQQCTGRPKVSKQEELQAEEPDIPQYEDYS